MIISIDPAEYGILKAILDFIKFICFLIIILVLGGLALIYGIKILIGR